MKTILVLTLLLFLHGAWASDPIGSEAREIHHGSHRPLRKLPTVKLLRIENGIAFIEVENRTGRKLCYLGYEKGSPIQTTKIKRAGKWTPINRMICGNGYEEDEKYTLRNKAKLTLGLLIPDHPVQIFATFRDAKDPKEFSAIKLYEKAGK